ncbi:MAG TPA: hypothetical protein VF707_14390 [Ardenticatenaceae bacterium]
MTDASRSVAPPSLPIVVVVGATRPQLRSFGLAIERAGYHVMVLEADRNVVENLSAQQADILAYNLAMGYTAILRGFRALPQQPALLLLEEDRALPADGFESAEQVYHTPQALEALLRRRLLPEEPLVVEEAPLPAAVEDEIVEEIPVLPPETLLTESPPVLATEETPAPTAPVQDRAPSGETTFVPLPEVTPAPPPRPKPRVTPAVEATPADETPRVRRRKKVQPKRREVPPVVWQSALLVAVALFLVWAIRQSDALQLRDEPGAAVRPTNEPVQNDVAATETALIAPEVESQGDPGPNLVAQIIEVTPAEPTVNDIVNVRVLVENVGTVPATSDFWVDLYVSPEGTPAANQAWPDIAEYGATWFVEGLDVGEEVVLDSLDADASRSNLLRFIEEGPVELFVYVDSYGVSPSGAVAEQDEANNLAGPFELFVSR